MNLALVPYDIDEAARSRRVSGSWHWPQLPSWPADFLAPSDLSGAAP